nr:MAG TPA: hypothetical protein [Caudoviricetes sp.]
MNERHTQQTTKGLLCVSFCLHTFLRAGAAMQ